MLASDLVTLPKLKRLLLAEAERFAAADKQQKQDEKTLHNLRRRKKAAGRSAGTTDGLGTHHPSAVRHSNTQQSDRSHVNDTRDSSTAIFSSGSSTSNSNFAPRHLPS